MTVRWSGTSEVTLMNYLLLNLTQMAFKIKDVNVKSFQILEQFHHKALIPNSSVVSMLASDATTSTNGRALLSRRLTHADVLFFKCDPKRGLKVPPLRVSNTVAAEASSN